MPKLPRITGKETIRKLRRLDFEVFDQTGSHVYLHKWERNQWNQRVTVPVHGNKILKLKTLKTILEQAEVDIDAFANA